MNTLRMADELNGEVLSLKAINAQLVEALEKVTERLLEADFDYMYERGVQKNSLEVLTLVAQAHEAIEKAKSGP